MPTSKVELYAAIRRDARAGMSWRALERKHGVGRRTVVKALESAWPEPHKKLPPRASKLDPFKPVIDAILLADLDAPRKQHHTVKRIFARLIDEHGMVDISYPAVRAYIVPRRPEVRVEAGRGPMNVFVPQSHRPGVEAEVDFGEVVVELRGQPVTCTLFAFRLSFSGKAVHQVFLSGGPHASHLIVHDGRVEVARHERLPAKVETRLELDHYLEALIRKPGALPGATALEQARAAGKFTPVHDAWWAAACKAHGDAAGARALIEVLLLHRHMTHDHVVVGLAAALRAGALPLDVTPVTRSLTSRFSPRSTANERSSFCCGCVSCAHGQERCRLRLHAGHRRRRTRSVEGEPRGRGGADGR